MLLGTTPNSEEVHQTIFEMLAEVAQKTGLSSVDDLFKAHVEDLFESFGESVELWNEHSARFLMFIAILENGGLYLEVFICFFKIH